MPINIGVFVSSANSISYTLKMPNANTFSIFTKKNIQKLTENCVSCRYERLGRAAPQENIDMAASIGFAAGFIAFNMLLYLVPVPSYIRRKFKDF